MARRLTYQIDYQINQAGLTALRQDLMNIRQDAANARLSGNLTNELKEADRAAKELDKALEKAFNIKLNRLNLYTFNQEITKSFGSVDQLKSKLEQVGKSQTFNNLALQAQSVNQQLKTSDKLLNNMAVTFRNTIRYGISSSIFNGLADGIQKAFEYTKSLDTSLNDIRIVSDKSADEMERFAVQANNAAKALGSTTRDYTNASLIYYQQGLNDEETAARAETTLKAANVTAQSGQDVSEQLTAIWNGYKVTAEETELYIDKVAKVAATSAANLEELSTGMSKVASAAKSAGVDIDQLNATLATVISVTREAPETIGSAFKTIYARLGDLQLSGEDEYGVKLGNITGKLNELGVQILEDNGEMREMGEIVEDIAEKWQGWTRAQKQAAAVAMAGKMQYSRLIALFDNWDMYTKYLNESTNALGTLDQQQNIYMESTAAHLKSLQTEWERLYDTVLDQNAINSSIDSMSGLMHIVNNLMAGLGGGLNDIAAIGLLVSNIFRTQIAGSINTVISNMNKVKQNRLEQNAQQQWTQAGFSQVDSAREQTAYDKFTQDTSKLQSAVRGLTQERYNELNILKLEVAENELLIAKIMDQGDKQGANAAVLQQQAAIQKKIADEEIKNYAKIENYIETITKANKNNQQSAEQAFNAELKLIQLIEEYQDKGKGMWDGQDVLTQQEQVALQTALNKLKNDEELLQADINAIERAQTVAMEQNTIHARELTEQARLQQMYEDGTLERLQRENALRRSNFNTGVDEGVRQAAIQTTIQNLTTLSMSLITVSGLFKTALNPDLSGLEKFEQITTTLLFMLPMLLSSIGSLKGGLTQLAIALGATGTAEQIAAQGALKATISIGALKVTLGELFLIIGAVIAVVSALALGIKALSDIYNKDAIAAQKAAEATKHVSESAEQARKSYEELKQTFNGYDDIIEKMKNLDHETQEWRDSLKEANEKAMELIKTNKELAQYATRDSSGLITFGEYEKDILKNAENKAYAMEASANITQIQANNATFQSKLTDFLREDKIGSTVGLNFTSISRSQLEELIEIVNEKGGLAKNDIESWVNSITDNDKGFAWRSSLIKSITDATSEITKLAKESSQLKDTNKLLLDDAIRKQLGQNTQYSNLSGIEQNAVATIYNSKLTEETINQIKEEVAQEWDNKSGWFGTGDKEIQERYAQLKGYRVLKNNIGDTADYYDPTTNTTIEKVKDEIALETIKAYEIAEKVANYNSKEIDGLISLVNKLFTGTKNINSQVSTELLEILTKQNMNFDATKTSFTDMKQLLGALENGQLIENLNKISSQEWLRAGYDNQKQFIETLGEQLQNVDWQAMWEKSLEKVSNINPNVRNLVTKSEKGEIDTLTIEKDEDYQAVKAQLEEIKNIYPELTTQAEIFSDTFLAGTSQWKDALYDIQIAVSNIKIDTAINNWNEALKNIDSDSVLEKIQIDIDSDQFEQQMDDLLSKDYSVNIEVSAQMDNEFSQVYDGITDIDDAISKIQEGWKVSRDNIVELGEMIPGIAENYQITTDGLIQLDEETARSAINTAQIRMEASKEETINDLKNAAASYNAKAEAYSAMADAATKAANNEIDSADAVHTIQAELDKIDEENSNLKAINEQKNSSETVSVTSENMQILIDNNIRWAETAIKNAQAVATVMAAAQIGDEAKANSVQVSRATIDRRVGASVQTTEQTDIDVEKGKAKAAKSKEEWEKLAEQYKSMAEANRQAGSKALAEAAALEGAFNDLTYDKSHIGDSKSSGSSGGKKESEPDVIDTLEDEKDRYHDIDIVLKQISNDLDKLDKQTSKLFGKDLIDNLNKQLNVLDKQIDATNEKIKIAKNEAEELKNTLSTRGADFNADGTLSNYTQIYTSQLNYVNGLIAQYNAMSAEAQESFKDTVEQAKEDFNQFVEDIKAYDTLISDTIPGLEKDIQDAIDKEIEIKITEFTMEIKIRLDMSEAERDWNEFKRKVIDGIKDTDILGNTRARLRDFNSYYNNENTGEVQSLMKQVQNTQAQLEQMDRTGWSDFYGDNRAQGLEDLKSYNDQLMKSMEDVEDLIEEIKKSYLDMMDEAADKFQDQVDMYEQVKDIIDHDMNIIKLVYGEDSYADLEKYYQMQEDNNNKQLDFLRQQKDFWYAQMQTLEQGSEEWQKAKENWMDAVSEWNNKVEEAVENIQNKYLNTINKIFDELNNKVTSGAGLDYVSEEWELINKNADQYLDTINSLYGIQSLENKYLDAIDQTDNLSAQRKLNDLMNEELDALREKDKLTQYDIDRANMKYEIALKQIALEEAQQNKSTMRLRRDSQGNYTYQYVADNDQIGQLQDELTTLKNELYNFDLEHYRDNLDQVLEIYQEFQEKMKEAAQINDPEERAAMELLLQEQYGELINGLVEQNETIRLNLHESAFTELADLYNTDLNNFQSLASEEQEVLLGQMIPQWDSGIQHMASTFAGEGGFIPTCKDAMEQLNTATKTYEQDLNEVQQAAEQDFGDIQRGIDETKTKTEELIQNNETLIQTYQNQLNEIQSVINELQSLCSQYDAVKIAAQQAAEAAYNYWRAVNNQAADAAGNNVSGGNSNSGNSSSDSRDSNTSSLSSDSGGDGATIGNQITYSGSYYYDSFGTKPSGSEYSGVVDGVTIDIVNNNPYGIHIKSSDGRYPDLGWIKRSQVTRWNTGGYTGDWGDDSGRLAILDRKELILNKDDTANMLNIIQLTRDFMNSMNNILLSKMINSVNGAPNIGTGMINKDTLEQNVHIDATFPNVKDAREVEEALNNLVNVASQRIGRNIKR